MATQPGLDVLIEKAKAGDRAAAAAVLEWFEDRLRAAVERQVAARRRGEVEADDVVQETFVQALGAIDRFVWRGEDSFYPWLYGIARNVLLKLAERSARARTLEIPERAAADAVAPSKAVRRAERFDRLERCLSKLKPEYREVLVLARLEGLTVREIAGRMGRTEAAVKHLVARALSQLRESFGDTESLGLPPRSFKSDARSHGRQ